MTLDFTELKKRFQPHSALALTFEPGALVVAFVRQGDGKQYPPLTLPLTAEAAFADPVKAGAELAAALEVADLRERRSVICLPPSWVLSASADLPELNAEDLNGYFELRAEREFAASDLRLAHNAYDLPDGKRRATLAALPAKRMEALEKLLEKAGCHPVSISLSLPGCFSKAEPTLHLLENDGQTDLIISCGGGCAAIRSIPSLGDADDPAAFTRELRITLGRLPESIRSRLRHARIVGSHPPTLRGILERMGIQFIEEEATQPGGAALECAQRHLHHRPIPFEFFIAEPNRWNETLERFNTRRGRRIAAAVTALIFLPLLGFSIRSHMENSLTTEWDGMKDTVGDLDVIQQKIRQFRPWYEPAPQKLQALRTVIAAFPDRGDLWTRSVQISPANDKNDASSRGTAGAEATLVTVTGFSRSNAVLMGLQDTLSKQAGVSAVQLKQLRGNNPIQFSLTFKWESNHER